MVKRILSFVCAVFLTLTFISCSDLQNNSASVSFKIPLEFFADQTDNGNNENATVFTVNASIFDGQIEKWSQSTKVSSDNDGTITNLPSFTFKALPAWRNLSIKISIFENNLKIYEYTTPSGQELRLRSGPNTIDLLLNRYKASPAVWIDKTSKNESLQSIQKLMQSVSYNSTSSKEALYTTSSSEEELLYAFDTNASLYLLSKTITTSDTTTSYSYILKEYTVDSSTLLYKENEKNINLKELSGSNNVLDFYYDSDNFYFLISNKPEASTSYSIYKTIIKIDNSDETVSYTLTTTSQFYINTNWSVTGTTITISELYGIAANKNTIVLSGLKDSGSREDTTQKNALLYGEITYDSKQGEETFSISGYAHIDTELADKKTSLQKSAKAGKTDVTVPDCNIKITDMQFGDGLGNYTDRLYVLLRMGFDNNSKISNTYTPLIYSSGALIEVNTTNWQTKLYGNNAKPQSANFACQKDGKETTVSGSVYAPNDNSNFWGPCAFAALVPKKIVIADDGTSHNSINNKIKNKDSLFEFDIESASISQGQEVSIGKVTENTGCSFSVE